MRRAFLVLVLLVILTGRIRALDPVTITDNRGKLDLYVIMPEDAERIGVVVSCDHLYKTSERDVAHRQEHFLFRELHDDVYEIEVVFRHRDGRVSRIVTHANVSR